MGKVHGRLLEKEGYSVIVTKLGTIFGVQVGFEIFTAADFAATDIPAEWGVMLNLFCVRISFTKYYE